MRNEVKHCISSMVLTIVYHHVEHVYIINSTRNCIQVIQYPIARINLSPSVSLRSTAPSQMEPFGLFVFSCHKSLPLSGEVGCRRGIHIKLPERAYFTFFPKGKYIAFAQANISRTIRCISHAKRISQTYSKPPIVRAKTSLPRICSPLPW